MTEQTPDQVAQPQTEAPAKPPVRINLDLDSLERDPAKAKREPFAFNLQGRAIILSDPEELDWEEVLAVMEVPHQVLNLAMSASDRKFMRKHNVPLWKIEPLAKAYMAYYDLGDSEGNDD